MSDEMTEFAGDFLARVKPTGETWVRLAPTAVAKARESGKKAKRAWATYKSTSLKRLRAQAAAEGRDDAWIQAELLVVEEKYRGGMRGPRRATASSLCAIMWLSIRRCAHPLARRRSQGRSRRRRRRRRPPPPRVPLLKRSPPQRPRRRSAQRPPRVPVLKRCPPQRPRRRSAQRQRPRTRGPGTPGNAAPQGRRVAGGGARGAGAAPPNLE